jgi:hypothetical protein
MCSRHDRNVTQNVYPFLVSAYLSVYLGHDCLARTQVYLTMIPELLQQANTRFERCAG